MKKTIKIDVLVAEAIDQLHTASNYRKEADDYAQKADENAGSPRDEQFYSSMASYSRRYSSEAYVKFELLESLLKQELGEDFDTIGYYYDSGLDENN